MAWEAHTAYETIDVGTVFSIFYSPQIQGMAAPLLTSDGPINIFLSNSSLVAQVRNAIGPTAELELPTGEIFEMTLCGKNDPKSPLKVTLTYQDWIIRKKL